MIGNGEFDVELATGASDAPVSHLLFIRSDIALGRSVGRSPNSSPRGRDQRELRERGNGRCYEALTLSFPG